MEGRLLHFHFLLFLNVAHLSPCPSCTHGMRGALAFLLLLPSLCPCTPGAGRPAANGQWRGLFWFSVAACLPWQRPPSPSSLSLSSSFWKFSKALCCVSVWEQQPASLFLTACPSHYPNNSTSSACRALSSLLLSPPATMHSPPFLLLGKQREEGETGMRALRVARTCLCVLCPIPPSLSSYPGAD